jgi:hypothetical protein
LKAKAWARSWLMLHWNMREPLFSFLLDTGLYLLGSSRERLPDNVGDIKDKARDTYHTMKS